MSKETSGDTSGGGGHPNDVIMPIVGNNNFGYKRKWAHGFWDLCYEDRELGGRFFPCFCPLSFPFSCVMVGLVTSKMSRAEPCLLEMDPMVFSVL